jgi:Caspase recruitment domain
MEPIRRNYTYMVETMNMKDTGLLAELYAKNVIDRQEKDKLESLESSTQMNERFLSLLSRKSSDQFQQFLEALDTTGQKFLADALRGIQAEVTPGSIKICFDSIERSSLLDQSIE